MIDYMLSVRNRNIQPRCLRVEDENTTGGGGGAIPASVIREMARYHLIYSLTGLMLGMVCIVGGLILFFHGVVGSTSWTASFLGASSKITDAAPGSVLFLVGLFIVFVTRFIVKTKHKH